MKRRLCSLMAILAVIFVFSACGKDAPTDGRFYDKTVEDFGVYFNVKQYVVKSSVAATDEKAIRYHGRYYVDGNAVWISYTNAGFEVTFKGTTLEGDFLTTGSDNIKNKPYLAVTVDGDYNPDHATAVQFASNGKYKNSTGMQNGCFKHEHVVLAHGLTDEVHTVRVYKRSECQNSRLAVTKLSSDGEIYQNVQAKPLSLKMEVYGDSITCGYAVESDDFYENFSTRTENGMKTYANYAANLLNSDISTICAGGYPMYQSIYSENNNPSSVPQMFSMAEFEYHTSPVHAWDNSKYIPDVVVIALGGNDGTVLSRYPEGSQGYTKFLEEYEKTYRNFVDTIYSAYPQTLVVISDEIIDINPAFLAIAEKIYNDYKLKGNKIIRATYQAYSLSKNRTLPGAGHPNAEMQKIAGYELAVQIANALDINIEFDDFMSNY